MKKLTENQKACLFVFAYYAVSGTLLFFGYQREMHNLPQDALSYIFKLTAISFMAFMLYRAKILPPITL